MNLFATNAALREAVTREGAAAFEDGLQVFGARCGSADAADWARQANERRDEDTDLAAEAAE